MNLDSNYDLHLDTLQAFVDLDQLGGAVVALADADGVRTVGACGYANRETQLPMTEDSLFWIASMTKPITAVAAMMLVDEGQLSLDAAIEEYLPSFKEIMVLDEAASTGDRRVLRRPASPPTVRQALMHRAGFSFGSPLEWPQIDRLPPA